jgi:N-acetylglutamate synthase-like GNAT family acetyltransferase
MQFAVPNNCPDKLFTKVQTYISNFELDNRAMQLKEFLVLAKNDDLFAFGRLRHHQHCDELCSIGVIEEARHIGLASKLIKALIAEAKQPLYLVSIIPAFFESLGFEICKEYPQEIKDKLKYCSCSLVVPEPYVVMRLKT